MDRKTGQSNFISENPDFNSGQSNFVERNFGNEGSYVDVGSHRLGFRSDTQENREIHFANEMATWKNRAQDAEERIRILLEERAIELSGLESKMEDEPYHIN